MEIEKLEIFFYLYIHIEKMEQSLKLKNSVEIKNS